MGGVDIVGPSNAKTLLDSIPPYWKPIRNDLIMKVGPVDEDEEFNRKISPLFHADKIKVPLLIGQGANDPRVKQAEADQIVQAMWTRASPWTTSSTPTRATASGGRRTASTSKAARSSSWRSTWVADQSRLR